MSRVLPDRYPLTGDLDDEHVVGQLVDLGREGLLIEVEGGRRGVTRATPPMGIR